MSIELHYGNQGTVRLDVPTERLLMDVSVPRPVTTPDPAAATLAALNNPLAFPPLPRAMVAGDRIAVTVARGVPHSESVVAGVIRCLAEGGASSADISLIIEPSAETSVDSVTAAIPDDLRRGLQISTHDPRDPKSLCYLAASRDNKPIYFNRKVFDADLVVPIGTLRLDQSFGYFGVHTSLFPAFSDDATRSRLRVPPVGDRETRRKRQRRETEEAAWLLGVQFTVQVVPGRRESLLGVFAGEADSVEKAGRTLCESTWRYEAPHRASLVVAAIEGGPEQQNWENFARALFAASECVAEGGTIVMCSDLQCRIGPALRRLATIEEGQERLQKALRHERSDDAPLALLLSQVMQQAKVYLLSGLNEDEVEDMGVGYIEREADVQRLALRHDSCIIMGNAQHAMVTISEN
jgi:nickel-dependent lactate racemase